MIEGRPQVRIGLTEAAQVIGVKKGVMIPNGNIFKSLPERMRLAKEMGFD